MRTARWKMGMSLALAGLLVSGGACDGTGGGKPPGPEVPEEPASNRAPTLGTVSAASLTVNEGSGTRLSVSASDPDGEPLTFTWSQSPATPAGTFSDEGGEARTWTAPLLSRDTTFTLKVTVSDGKGGTAQGSVPVKVVNVAALNQAPVVDEDINVDTPEFIAGRTMSFFIAARDLDGDPLTYEWKTSPEGQGVFSNPEQALARWRSDELAAATDHTLHVTVSDGTASVTRSVKVRVTVPSYSHDIEAIWSANCAACHNQYSPEGLNLVTGQSHASLVGRAATGACSPQARVTPGRPDESLLLWRLVSGDCGNRMPQGNSSHFDDNPGELTQIRSWILAGARND